MRIPDGRAKSDGLRNAGFRGNQIEENSVQKPEKHTPGNSEEKATQSPKTVLTGREAGVALSKVFRENSAVPVAESPEPFLAREAVRGAAPFIDTAPELSAGKTVFAGEMFKETAAALGFPKDALSVSLLAFLRFFSLSPRLLESLRREYLGRGKQSSPGTAREKAALESEALAAVAARDKGVALGREALERYARFFVSPSLDTREDETGNGGGKNPREENPPSESSAENPREAPARLRKEKTPPGADELRALGSGAQKDGFLDILNSLPGKDGHYWMVFPFNITVGATELRVFIRILKRKAFSSGESGHIIADISGPKRSWRFFLKNTAGTFRADIRVYPGCHPRTLKRLRKEAERFLGKTAGAKNSGGKMSAGTFGGFEEIRLENGEGIPSWAEELCGERLPSINELVE